MLFKEMLSTCLKGTEVLSRQYTKSFDTVDDICEPVLSSVRQHTMLAESVMGEFFFGGGDISTCLCLQNQQHGESKEKQPNAIHRWDGSWEILYALE